MMKRAFGKLGVDVSVLGFGAAHVGADHVDDATAERVLNEVLDQGINFIDTARGYGNSEELIGKYISHRRDDFILSTKGGYGVEGVEDWTAECITKGVDRALETMKTDHIDVFHFHSCDKETLEKGEVTDALLKAKEAGKVRFAAYSGENEARRFAIESGAFDVIQSSINICEQHILRDDMPLLMERGMGVIAKRPLANVFWRFDQYPEGEYCAPYWERADRMRLVPPDGMGWLEFALRFVAFEPGVSTIIAGTSNINHLQENAKMLEKGPLDPDMVNQLKVIFDEKDDNWVGQV